MRKSDLEPRASVRPWREVARMYNERTGEKLSKNGVRHICLQALRKLKEQLREGGR